MRILLFTLIVLCLFYSSCGSKSSTPAGEVKDWKKYVENQKSLAIASYRRGNYKQALTDIEEAYQRAKRDPEVYLIKGIIYFGLKDYSQAEEFYKKSLKLDKDYIVASFNLCGLYIKINKPAMALEYCEKATVDPLYEDKDKALTNLGTAYLMQGDINKAKIYYNKSLEVNPLLVYTHNELGKMHLSVGNDVEAIREFKIAVEGYPQYDEAFFNLGLAYLKQGNKPSACSAFSRVLQLVPNSKMGLDARNYIDSVCTYSSGDIN
ncbi:MAG: tetratricopeptide repeat protein [Thermodesulfobacteriota bacterium]